MIVGAIVVAATGGFLALSRGESGDGPTVGPSPGPLQTQAISANVSVTGIQLAQGRTGSLGITITLDGPMTDSALVLDGVGLIDASPGLLVNGAFVSTGSGERYACVGSAASFPPKGCTSFPVRNWRISADAAAHQGFQIVLGVGTTGEAQVDSFAALAVSYHSVEGQTYRLVVPQAGRVCLPKDEPGCGAGLGSLEQEVNNISADLVEGTYVAPLPSPVWPP